MSDGCRTWKKSPTQQSREYDFLESWRSYYQMKERAEEILNELFPEGAADRPGDPTAHVYSRSHHDEIVVWLEGAEPLGEDALWQAFARAREALEAGGFEYVEWDYRWKPGQAGGKFRPQTD